METLPDEKPQPGTPHFDAFIGAVAVPGITLDSSMSPVRAEAGHQPPAVLPTPEIAPSPVALPSVDEVFAKYKQALGSPDAVQKVSTLVEKGTVEMEIPPAPGASPAAQMIIHRDAEVDRELPNKVLYLIHMPSNLSREGYDGFNAWVAGGFSREETAGERGVVQTKAEFFPALRFKETHSELKVEAIEKVGSREAYRVSGFRQDGTGYDRIDIDTQTGLLLRLSTSMSSVLGSFPVEIDYDDYRDVSGLKLPFTMREANPEGDRVFTWDQIEYNGKVEDSAFNVPPSAAGAT